MKGLKKNFIINLNFALLLFVIVLLCWRITIKEYFEDATDSINGKKSDKPIENIGIGPFEYGLNDQYTVSPGTVEAANYMGQQAVLTQKGDVHTNMLDYFK